MAAFPGDPSSISSTHRLVNNCLCLHFPLWTSDVTGVYADIHPYTENKIKKIYQKSYNGKDVRLECI